MFILISSRSTTGTEQLREAPSALWHLQPCLQPRLRTARRYRTAPLFRLRIFLSQGQLREQARRFLEGPEPAPEPQRRPAATGQHGAAAEAVRRFRHQ